MKYVEAIAAFVLACVAGAAIGLVISANIVYLLKRICLQISELF